MSIILVSDNQGEVQPQQPPEDPDEAKRQVELRLERLLRAIRKDEETMRRYLERKRLLRRLRASEARNQS